MKKLLALLLALALILTLSACGETETAPAQPEQPTQTEQPEQPTQPEQTEDPAPEATPHPMPDIPEPPAAPTPEEALAGSWYGTLQVVSFCLDLHEDGSYELSVANSAKDSVRGSWVLNDGFIWLDGDESAPLSVRGETLYWPLTEVVFTREQPADLYAPAALRGDTAVGEMDGYWICSFVDMNGQIWPAELFGENTDLYIEGQRAALGGDLFGDVLVDMDFSEGALVLSEGDDALRLSLQEDGMLRLVLSDESGPCMTLFLTPLGTLANDT